MSRHSQEDEQTASPATSVRSVRCVLARADAARWRDVAAVHEASATAAYAHIFPGPFPREEAAERWRTYDGRLLLALDDGAAVGFAAWTGHLLDALYVLPRHSGHGIGRQLLAALPASVDALWVLVDNARGRAFYARNGWADTGVVRPAYARVDEVLYRRGAPPA